MSDDLVTDILIPARNCEAYLGDVLSNIPGGLVRSVVVVDNASEDSTAAVARDGGAIVVRERRKGRGGACRRGLLHLESLPEPPDIIVFMAADGSDDPADLPSLLAPLSEDNAELVIGVRPQQVSYGTAVSLKLIGAIYRHQFQDLGSYRAIRFPALVALSVRDRGEGWDAEMQVKALRLGLNIVEVPVTLTDFAESRRNLVSKASRTGRSLFQILRHSTAR